MKIYGRLILNHMLKKNYDKKFYGKFYTGYFISAPDRFVELKSVVIFSH